MFTFWSLFEDGYFWWRWRIDSMKTLGNSWKESYFFARNSWSTLRRSCFLTNYYFLLWTENGRLKYKLDISHTHLEDEYSLLQTTILHRYNENFRNINILEIKLKHVFLNLIDEFGNKTNLFDDFKEGLKNIFHTYITHFKENTNRLETYNTLLENKVVYLQAFVDEHHEEATTLQEQCLVNWWIPGPEEILWSLVSAND